MISNNVILALGADIKNRALAARGSRIFAGRETGDLFDARNFGRFKRGVRDLIRRIGARPRIVACDLHPG